jgi:hypothetical protein
MGKVSLWTCACSCLRLSRSKSKGTVTALASYMYLKEVLTTSILYVICLSCRHQLVDCMDTAPTAFDEAEVCVAAGFFY